MALLLPTPSVDRDPGRRQIWPTAPAPWPRPPPSRRFVPAWTTAGQGKERAVAGWPPSALPRAVPLASVSAVASLSRRLASPLHSRLSPSLPRPLPRPRCSQVRPTCPRSLSSPAACPAPSSALSPSRPRSSPCLPHPVPPPWCVLVSASARPGRTDGSLLRPRSPWAPTPPPPLPGLHSAVRERFPKLLRLDGHELPPPIAFDVEAPTALPPCKGSYFGTEALKNLVLHFLQQYYAIYDSGDRQGLLDAYHDGACCSLSIPFTPQNPARSNLAEYFKDSRNVKKLKDPTLRFRLLKHTRLNVVAFLNELPKTQHDINSFVVDISAQTSTLLCFSVNGVFKEVDGKARDSLRAFTRTFIAVPASNSGLCIVNDELFVRNASPDESQRAFAMPAPTPSSSPVPTLSPEQQEMLQAFSTQSGMNLEWSQKCLQDNNWDYTRSAQAFTLLKAKDKIPEVAFMK